MSSLIVVGNPRPKGKRKLTGAAKAAFLARMAGGRKKAHKPKRRKSSKSHHSAPVVARQNPRRPKRKNSFFSIGKLGGHKKRVRRNPINYESSLLTAQLEPALWGAAGAVGAGMVFSALASKLPANFQTGLPRQIAKAGLIIGLGMLGERFLPRDKAQAATIGALTITAYTAALPYVAKAAPNSNLGRQLNAQLSRQLGSMPQRNALTRSNALGPRGVLSGVPGRMAERTDSLATAQPPAALPYQRPTNPAMNRAAGGSGWRGSRR
ncbi:MAG: hypothetical protein OSA97_01455 [Nevskia sp.]|nr:hypothetical protein [Nevskia sp.]